MDIVGKALKIFRRFRAVVLLAALALAACSSDGEVGDGSAGLCPQTAILDDPGQIVRFKPNTAKGPGDLVFHLKMKTFSGECEFDEKEIALDLRVSMEALRGPANEKGRAEFVYFVAILGLDKKVLVRQDFPIIVEFDGNDTQMNFTEDVTIYIPRRKNDSTSDYLVYLGYEMTEEELAYNRRRLNRR
jgi:hypothetical protein